MLQATTFTLSGAQEKLSELGFKRGGNWPLFRAEVLNSDGTILDARASWNDCELARWLDSFGFDLADYDERSTIGDF